MNLFLPYSKRSPIENWLLPFMGLVFIVVIDRSINSVLLTPMLSVSMLAILAFRLEPKILAFWAAILACNVVLSLIDVPGGSPGASLNMGTVFVRSVGFLVSGSIALVMNRAISYSTRSHNQLLEIFKRLPLGVVVSDQAGSLLFSNNKASELLGKSPERIVGNSFFSLFVSSEKRGHTIENYIHLIDREIPCASYFTTAVDSGGTKKVHATQIPMNLLDQKCVVTVIDSDTE
ncbi:hypothetical protein BH09VER1_BH09VER1_41970 [soil metagenome]